MEKYCIKVYVTAWEDTLDTSEVEEKVRSAIEAKDWDYDLHVKYVTMVKE